MTAAGKAQMADQELGSPDVISEDNSAVMFKEAVSGKAVTDYSRSHVEEATTLMDIEATRFRLATALHQSMQEDLNYSRECLIKIAKTVELADFDAQRFILKPSIFLFPFPVWSRSAGMLTCRVYSLDGCSIHDGNLKIARLLRGLPLFARSNRNGFSEEQHSFADRVNLIKALTVFFEEMISVDSGAAEGMSVDYDKAAGVLANMLFVGPKRPKAESYHFEGYGPIIIDDLKLMEFQAQLRWYFEQKAFENSGKLMAGTAITHVRLTTPYREEQKQPSGSGGLLGLERLRKFIESK